MNLNLSRVLYPEVVDGADAGVEPKAEPQCTHRLPVVAQRARRRWEVPGHQKAVRHLPRLQVSVLPQPSMAGNHEHFVKILGSKVGGPALQHCDVAEPVLEDCAAKPLTTFGVWIDREQWQVRDGTGFFARAEATAALMREVTHGVRRAVSDRHHRLPADRAPGRWTLLPGHAPAVLSDIAHDVDESMVEGVECGFHGYARSGGPETYPVKP